MKDLHSKLLIATAIGAAVLAADTASPALDLLGYNAAEVVLTVGAGGIVFSNVNRIDFVLTHSDDGVNFVPVAANDVLGAVAVSADGIFKSLIAAHAAPATYRFGYKGSRRYLKVVADFSGAHGTGTPIAVLLIRGSGFNRPEPDQA